MGIQKLFRIGVVRPSQGSTNLYRTNYAGNNFIKNTFNFGEANPNRPDTRVAANALGDPQKGCNLYCLG